MSSCKLAGYKRSILGEDPNGFKDREEIIVSKTKNFNIETNKGLNVGGNLL